GGSLDGWIKAVEAREAPWTASRYLAHSVPSYAARTVEQVRTDAQGRFQLKGVGRERLVELTLEGPALVHTSISVATRRMSPITRLISTPPAEVTEQVYGA